MQRFRLFGQLPRRNKLKGPGSRLPVSPFPEIKCILACFYYRPRPESAEELELLREEILVGRRRVRLMKKLALLAVSPKRNISKRHLKHKVYPYLLRGKTIDQPNQVWAAGLLI